MCDNPTRVLLIEPYGVPEELARWNLHCLQRHLERCYRAQIRVHSWPMGRDPAVKRILEELWSEHRPLLIDILDSTGARETLRFEWPAVGYLLTVALAHADRIPASVRGVPLAVAACLTAAQRAWLRQQRSRLLSRLDAKLATLRTGSPSLVGLSAAKGTLLSALWLATEIRAREPKVPILLGGSAIDRLVAKQVVADIDAITAAVHGVGENVIEEVVRQIRRGEPLQATEAAPRLVTKVSPAGFEATDDERRCREDALSVFAGRCYGEVLLDRRPEEVAIRVLSTRGCGWGRCTFCADSSLVRTARLEADRERIKEEVLRLIDDGIEARLWHSNEEGPSAPVILDADDNDIDFVMDLASWLQRIAEERSLKIGFSGWLSARQFSRAKLPRALRELRSRYLSCYLMTAIESLNPKTLVSMRKGTTALRNISALKTAQDLGARTETSYFVCWPGESAPDVEREQRYLRSAMHLLTRPRCDTWFTKLALLKGSRVHDNPADYGLVAGEAPLDPWAREMFGLQLPLLDAKASVPYVLGPDSHDGSTVPAVYQRLIQSSWAFVMAMLSSDSQPEKAQWPATARGAAGRRFLRDLGRLLLAELRRGSLPYFKRALLLAEILFYQTDRESAPRFFLDGRTLVRDGGFQLGRRLSMKLSDEEFAVLRSCYFETRREVLCDSFASSLSRETVEAIIDKHLRLGSLVHGGAGSLLAVFHDPEGLAADLDCQRQHGQIDAARAALSRYPRERSAYTNNRQ